MTHQWPKDITEWYDGTTGYMSIPFTWLLHKAKGVIRQRRFFVKKWVVGGPAVKLLPAYLRNYAEYGPDDPNVLQRVNPDATRTTVSCPRGCEFCGVQRICGPFRVLDDWPDRPIVCDDNLLAAPEEHKRMVIERLRSWPECDFNQGIDCRLLDKKTATLLATLKKPIIRLALDSDEERTPWSDAVERLRSAGVSKSRIRSYVLCGFTGGPAEDKERCLFAESFGVKPLPMWFHRLDAMEHNEVTAEQRAMGWTPRNRRQLFCWFYWHRTLDVRG